jgi:N-acetylglucosaminyl-diphospho-decaprenol L-rhamnosyltransferase
MADVTVVVVGFQPDDALFEACLGSVKQAGAAGHIDLELLVVDNGGVPGDVVARHGGLMLGSGRNVGFAVAANTGVAAARGRYCLLLNPDAELVPGALAALMDVHQRGEGDLLVGWLETNASVQTDALFSWWYSTERLVRRSSERRRLILAAEKGTPVEVTKVSGGALFATTELLADLGPFDESFFLYGEDVDLSLRARGRGLRLVAVPQAPIRHKGAASHADHGPLVEQARVDAALRLVAIHRGWLPNVVARLELLAVTLLGLLMNRTTSGSRATRFARLTELRRWGVRRSAPRFAPLESPKPALADMLVIAPWLQGGGAQRALEGLLAAARPAAYIRTIVLFDQSRNYQTVENLSDEFAAWDLSRGPTGIIRASIGLRRSAKSADVIFSLTRGSNCVVGLSGIRRRRLVLAQHMLLSLEGKGLRHKFEDMAYARAIKAASCVAVPSELGRREFEARFRNSRGKVRVIDNPFVASERPLVEVRERPLKDIRLAFAGRLEMDKGLDLLIPILQSVLDRPCELRVAGTGSQLEMVGRYSREHGGHLSVVTLGWQDEITTLLDWCDAVVLPSRAELLPYAVREAWARGRPVLGSDIEPLAAMAAQGPLYTLPMEPGSWRNALSELADADQMSKDARERGPVCAETPDTSDNDLGGYLEILGLA